MEQRDVRPRTATIERPGTSTPQNPRGAPRPPNAEERRRKEGVRDLIGGCVLIGIGFLFGGSVFMGDPTILDWIFDGLGIFWISKGIYTLATANSKSSV